MTDVVSNVATIVACTARSRVRALAAGTRRGRLVDVVPPVDGAGAVRRHRPDLVVADVAHLDDLARVSTVFAEAPTIVVADVPAELALLPCLATGARGFVLEPADDDVFDHAVAAVLAGGVFVDPRCAEVLVRLAVDGRRARTGDGLTLRQVQVLQLADEGLTNREIARSLAISPDTVKTHLRRAMAQLDAHGRLDAAARAVRRAR